MEENLEIEERTQKKAPKLPIMGAFGASLLLVILITLQSPGDGGPMVILVFLLLIFLLAVSLCALCIEYVSRKTSSKKISKQRLLYTSVVLGTGVVFLVGLQTLRQLQPVDLALVVAFEILLVFYLLRRF